MTMVLTPGSSQEGNFVAGIARYQMCHSHPVKAGRRIAGESPAIRKFRGTGSKVRIADYTDITQPKARISIPIRRQTLTFPTQLKRLATLVAQPVAIRFPVVSKISSFTVSVNSSPP